MTLFHRSKLSSALAAAALSLGIAAQADAATLGGAAGSPVYNSNHSSQSNCLLDSYSSVKNVCSQEVEINFSLLVLNAGSKSVKVTGSGTTSDPSSCVAVAMDRYSTSLSQSSWINLPSTTSFVTMTPSVNVPAAGYLYLFCKLKPGATINSVNWNE